MIASGPLPPPGYAMAEHALVWGAEPTQDDKTWALVAHLSGFLGFLGPLVVMLVFGEKSPYIRYHAVQELLAQVILGALIGVYAAFVSVVAAITCGIGIVLLAPLPLVWLVPAWGAWMAYEGKWQGFPVIESVGR